MAAAPTSDLRYGSHARTKRRSELAAFLKARRAGLTPDDVGLPSGSRRRTPGLRREEVAQLAAVGVTWYTWLEQGRPINVSMQVLDAVSRSLRLDAAEREHLYHLAEATPVRAERPEDSDLPELAQIVEAMDPLPAILLNSRFDILRSNRASKALFAGWHSLPCVHWNLLWCTVTEPLARERFVNCDEEVRYLVARLRAEFGQHLGEPAWEESIARLADLSPEFAQLWARHEVADAQPRRHVYSHPLAGELRFTTSEFTLTGQPELRLFVFTPADDDTRDRLPLTRTPRPA